MGELREGSRWWVGPSALQHVRDVTICRCPPSAAEWYAFLTPYPKPLLFILSINFGTPYSVGFPIQIYTINRCEETQTFVKMQNILFSGFLAQLYLALLAHAAPVVRSTVGHGHGNAWQYGTGGGILGLVVLILDVIVFSKSASRLGVRIRC